MKSLILYALILVVIVVGGSYFLPANKSLNLPDFAKPKSQKISPKPVSIDAPRDCQGIPTPDVTEGPYYKDGSPQRAKLIESGIEGDKLILTGYVFDTNCQPINRAWVDFWQADSKGQYDNSGFRLRGHQFTDPEGKYYLETITPGEYTGRTPHIHAAIRANENSRVVITQLYFPGKSRNKTDPIYDNATLIKIENRADGKVGTYNFVVEKK